MEQDIDFSGLDTAALARAGRQAEYMRAARRNEEKTRRRRFDDLHQRAAGVLEACTAYEWIGAMPGRIPLDELVIREPFVLCDPPRALPVSDPEDDGPAIREDIATRPAMTQLVHRRGGGLGFYLTALWDAQTSTAPEKLYKPGRELIHHAQGWDRLTGLRRWELTTRQRQLRLQRVLRELAATDLVALPGPRTKGRFDEFTLLTDGHGATRYRVPPTPGPGVRVPAGLITNGWHLVLTPPEIVVLIMLYDAAARYPTAHFGGDGVGIAPRRRRTVYGVTPEIYEAHNELYEFGLVDRIDSVPGRRRGRVAPPSTGEDPLVTYSFKVKADALARPACDVVYDTLANPHGGRFADEVVQLLA